MLVTTGSKVKITRDKRTQIASILRNECENQNLGALSEASWEVLDYYIGRHGPCTIDLRIHLKVKVESYW